LENFTRVVNSPLLTKVFVFVSSFSHCLPECFIIIIEPPWTDSHSGFRVSSFLERGCVAGCTSTRFPTEPYSLSTNRCPKTCNRLRVKGYIYAWDYDGNSLPSQTVLQSTHVVAGSNPKYYMYMYTHSIVVSASFTASSWLVKE
jgi:hypothetical protein